MFAHVKLVVNLDLTIRDREGRVYSNINVYNVSFCLESVLK